MTPTPKMGMQPPLPPEPPSPNTGSNPEDDRELSRLRRGQEILMAQMYQFGVDLKKVADIQGMVYKHEYQLNDAEDGIHTKKIPSLFRSTKWAREKIIFSLGALTVIAALGTWFANYVLTHMEIALKK
jgi:hypothetical protein